MEPTFIESISFQQGEMPLIQWHQRRFIKTQQANFGRVVFSDLSDCLMAGDLPNDGQKYKCRVLYSATTLQVEFTPYLPRVIKNLIISVADHIDYTFKSADRTELNLLTKGLLPIEEVLIVKHGFLTDSSFTNLAFFKKGYWYTPDTPLLEGVQRQSLLEGGLLQKMSIHVTDLRQFTKIRLLNAMMPWEETWELPIDVIS